MSRASSTNTQTPRERRAATRRRSSMREVDRSGRPSRRECYARRRYSLRKCYTRRRSSMREVDRSGRPARRECYARYARGRCSLPRRDSLSPGSTSALRSGKIYAKLDSTRCRCSSVWKRTRSDSRCQCSRLWYCPSLYGAFATRTTASAAVHSPAGRPWSRSRSALPARQPSRRFTRRRGVVGLGQRSTRIVSPCMPISSDSLLRPKPIAELSVTDRIAEVARVA